MPSVRTERVAELIQHELANLLHYKACDPRFVDVTITFVNVSPDLKAAKVFVTVLKDEHKEPTLLALNKAQGFFRSELAHTLNMRITPKLTFIYDDTLDRANRLSALIDKANKNNVGE